jgi:hypothetical protein
MSNSDDALTPPRKRWFLQILGYLALLIVVGAACGLLYWATRPNRVVATAMFRVASRTETVLGEPPRRYAAEYEIFKKSQLAALKSHFVVTSALRKPGIRSLAILAPHEDPVEWLIENLQVGFPEEGEYLAIELEGTEEQKEDLQLIVDAIAKAYSDEVVFKDRQRELGNRDLLASTLDKLNQESRKKSEDLADIAREMNQAGSMAGDAMQKVLLRRFDRLEAEILRLEDEQMRKSAGDEAIPEFYEKRLAQLRDRQDEVGDAIIRGQSAELTARQKEVRQLQQLADEISEKVDRLEIEANAPRRIEQVQQAIVAPTGDRSL